MSHLGLPDGTSTCAPLLHTVHGGTRRMARAGTSRDSGPQYCGAFRPCASRSVARERGYLLVPNPPTTRPRRDKGPAKISSSLVKIIEKDRSDDSVDVLQPPKIIHSDVIPSATSPCLASLRRRDSISSGLFRNYENGRKRKSSPR